MMQNDSNPTRLLSVSTSSIDPMSPEATFVAAKRAGYAGVELMVSPSKLTQNANHIKDLIQKHQIPVTSVHAPTLLLCKFVWTTNPEIKLAKSVSFAEQIGAANVVVHPPFKGKPHAERILNQINTINQNNTVQAGIENMFPWSVRGRSREIYGPSWEDTISKVDSLVFDFSHAALSGMNVMEFFENHWQKVRLIHLTDGSSRNRMKGDSIKDEHLLPGEGDMPIAEVYQLLNQKGWTGETVLEINTRQEKSFEGKLESLRKSLAYFNSVNAPDPAEKARELVLV